MAHNAAALEKLLNTGLRQNKLQDILASNAVLDWFGRTFTGRQRIIDFYLKSNNYYEHHMTTTETTEAFEDRSSHMQTLNEPQENFVKPIEFNHHGEQWFECETHSPADMKEALRTPPKRLSSVFAKCPPAPCRKSLLNAKSDDDEESTSDSDSELGVRPLDSSLQITIEKVKVKPKTKRQKIEKVDETSVVVDPTLSDESKFSNLNYLESSGVVHVKRQASTSTSSTAEESDRREIKLLISYRVNKENSNDIQIALIVYKSNNSNLKTRRNLLLEFEDEEVATQEIVEAANRCSTAVKGPEKSSEIASVSSAPPKVAKGTKRPMMSRHCLRF